MFIDARRSDVRRLPFPAEDRGRADAGGRARRWTGERAARGAGGLGVDVSGRTRVEADADHRNIRPKIAALTVASEFLTVEPGDVCGIVQDGTPKWTTSRWCSRTVSATIPRSCSRRTEGCTPSAQGMPRGVRSGHIAFRRGRGAVSPGDALSAARKVYSRWACAYVTAYAAHPERFVQGRPRRETLPTTVRINPPTKSTAQDGASVETLDDREAVAQNVEGGRQQERPTPQAHEGEIRAVGHQQQRTHPVLAVQAMQGREQQGRHDDARERPGFPCEKAQKKPFGRRAPRPADRSGRRTPRAARAHPRRISASRSPARPSRPVHTGLHGAPSVLRTRAEISCSDVLSHR